MSSSVSTISQVGSFASNDNPLWPISHGHMSEKGMKNIIKEGLLGNHRVESL